MPNERERRREAREGEVDNTMEPPLFLRSAQSVPQGGIYDPVCACEVKSRGCLTPKWVDEGDPFLQPKMTRER